MRKRKNQQQQSHSLEESSTKHDDDDDDNTPTQRSIEFNPFQNPKISSKASSSSSSSARKTVCIVVLGDIGRSPRMRYHAESFAKENFLVTIIGYGDSGRTSSLPKEIKDNPLISTVTMSEAPNKFLQKVPRMLAYPLKVSWMLLQLTFAFLRMVLAHQFRPDFILLQNPPAIPTLACCWVYSKIFFSDLIIDWHNYGYSIMGMGMKNKEENNPVLRFATWFEMYFGSKGDSHICVTRGMAEDLESRIGIKPVVLYDRPPEIFRSLSQSEQNQFLERFCDEYYPELREDLLVGKGQTGGGGRGCGVLVSSTSWTEDEDFGILLQALEYYDGVVKGKSSSSSCNEECKYPDLVVFITGKGPMKEYYKNKIAESGLKHVRVYLPWLEHADYPKLLGVADLGVSLHLSSSGLDLPMKVVDMFGCGLPVCAMRFPCIGELVKNGENGWVFGGSEELGEQIVEWFEGFCCSSKNKEGKAEHREFRENLKKFQELRWHENWVENVMPLLVD